MRKDDDGGPVFPTSDDTLRFGYGGMTLADHAAIEFVKAQIVYQGMEGTGDQDDGSGPNIIPMAYEWADNLIAEKRRRE